MILLARILVVSCRSLSVIITTKSLKIIWIQINKNSMVSSDSHL